MRRSSLRTPAVVGWVSALLVSGLVATTGYATAAVAGTTERVSLDSSGGQADSASVEPSVTADGRYVAFFSDASNLVAGDTNGTADIFVRDRVAGTTMRVSVDPAGGDADSASFSPSISADGRYVAFFSYASNLVAGDANGAPDVYVRDLLAGTTALVSVDPDGGPADNASFSPSISADGRHVALMSFASNLVAGDANGAADVFVRDLVAGTTELVSVDSAGGQADFLSDTPSISGDGRVVAFWSPASNLVVGDTNGAPDVFVRDLDAETTELVSVDSAGGDADSDSYNPAISGDGRVVAFWSFASNLVAGDANGVPDVFARDLDAGTTELVSVDSAGGQPGYGSESSQPSVSADGRYVAFVSSALNLVAGDTNGKYDVFMRDREAGTTERVSVEAAGGQADGDSSEPAINADGQTVAFTSDASNLVADDTNARSDVFVRGDPDTAPPTPGVITEPAVIPQTDTDFTVSWSATDAGSGVASYDVRYRIVGLPGHIAWQTATPDTSATFTGDAGSTYCFSARATDNEGHLGDYGAKRCAVVPVDDDQLTPTGDWITKERKKYYDNSLSRSRQPGATLTRTEVKARYLGVLVSMCSNCGSFQVRFNGKLLTKYGTDTTTIPTKCTSCDEAVHRQVIVFNLLGSIKTGTLEIRVTKNRWVGIDGYYAATLGTAATNS